MQRRPGGGATPDCHFPGIAGIRASVLAATLFLAFLATSHSIALAQNPASTPPEAKIHSLELVGFDYEPKKNQKLRVEFSTNKRGADRSIIYVRRVTPSEHVDSGEVINPVKNHVYKKDMDPPTGGWLLQTPYTVRHRVLKQGSEWNGIVQFQFIEKEGGVWEIQYIEQGGN